MGVIHHGYFHVNPESGIAASIINQVLSEHLVNR